MSSRSWLRSRLLCRLRPPAFRARARLVVESLEERAVPSAAISISDATAVEGDGAMKFLDSFVPARSGGLINARGIDYGPDGNLYVSGETIPPDPSRGFVNRYDATT